MLSTYVYRFLPDVLGHFQFDIAEPLVRVQTFICRLSAQTHDAVGAPQCSWQT